MPVEVVFSDGLYRLLIEGSSKAVAVELPATFPGGLMSHHALGFAEGYTRWLFSGDIVRLMVSVVRLWDGFRKKSRRLISVTCFKPHKRTRGGSVLSAEC
jgi:hypothetical protein